MKVCVADIANEHKAGPIGVASLRTDHLTGIFASLLDLGEAGSGMSQGTDEAPRKQGGRTKEKNDNESRPSVPGSSTVTATLNPVNPSIIADVAPTQWRFDKPSSSLDPVGSGNIVSGPQTSPAGAPAPTIYVSATAPNTLTMGMVALKLQQAPHDDVADTALLQNVSDLDIGRFPKSLSGGPDIEATSAQASSNDSGVPLISAASTSSTSTTVQQPTGAIDIGMPGFIAQANLDTVPGTPVGSRRATPGDTKPEGESKASTSNPSWPLIGSSAENRGGAPGLHAPLQGGLSLSSSMAGGRQDQNSADGAHHNGASDDKRAVADVRLSAPEKQSDTLGTPALSGSLQGHSTVLNANHSESLREATTNTQFKDPGSVRPADENVARLLGGAMRGDLRVGVQTEAFGHVTIQANAQGGQLSAQLSLENAKESATLAAHLPIAEHRLTQQHGVTASVRLAPGSGGAGGGFSGRDQSGSNRGDSGPYGAGRLRQMEHNTSSEGRGVETALIVSRYFGTSKLDVTV